MDEYKRMKLPAKLTLVLERLEKNPLCLLRAQCLLEYCWKWEASLPKSQWVACQLYTVMQHGTIHGVTFNFFTSSGAIEKTAGLGSEKGTAVPERCNKFHFKVYATSSISELVERPEQVPFQK